MPDERSTFQIPYPPAVDPRVFVRISDADVERIAAAVVRQMDAWIAVQRAHGFAG